MNKISRLRFATLEMTDRRLGRNDKQAKSTEETSLFRNVYNAVKLVLYVFEACDFCFCLFKIEPPGVV